MSNAAPRNPSRIDQFFAGVGARGDQWRTMVELAEAWAAGSGSRPKFESALAKLAATEEFHAYPGIQLMSALRDRAAQEDARATASLARHITRAILTRSSRQNPGDWDEEENDGAVATDVLPPALGRTDSNRPYFEVAIVTGAPPARWPALAVE